MYAQLGNTIQSIKSRAVFQRRDISCTPMAGFLAGMNKSSVKGQVNIEEAAVGFYLSNHGFHLIESTYSPGVPLPPAAAALAERHATFTSGMALRMLHYLLVISAQEMQFGSARNEGLYDFVETSTSPSAAEWLRRVLGRKTQGGLGSESDVGTATLGACCKAMEMGFRFAQWSGGFGGLPWAQIAETAGEVIRGANSLELMVDKAFTLCHNNGAIFNKGHQFTHYASDFYTILDIQASGQIPAAVSAGVKCPGMAATAVKATHAAYASLFPEEFNTSYDPGQVKSMQAVRDQKMKAAKAKAVAFLGAGGGWGGAPAPSGPPKRACDDLFSLEDLSAITSEKKVAGFS